MSAPLHLTPNDSAVRSDPVAQLALTLARELWVVKDRLMVLETVLSSEGRSIGDLVDRHVPTAASKAAIDAERSRFIGEILAALEPPGDRR